MPHRGPLNRRNRLLVGLARQLAGVPAPGKSPTASTSSSRSSSPHGFREKIETQVVQHEEELAFREAESIVKRGEAEANLARHGAYSERPADASETSSLHSARQSRESSPVRTRDELSTRSSSRPRHLREDSTETTKTKHSSWSNASQMTPNEIAVANAHLLTRLQPFLANPLVNTPISAFFYNDKLSRQKTIETNTSGHFSIRAALDFVPTHVRILASEKLSATEEVLITEPKGVSIISDIDDTIKHSAISSGAKEIFRNVFVRELGELSVSGVKDWYQKLAKLGVKFHYVSNSPWQLYPVLTGFFSAAGLPPGSFHLKQYSGMLQGIFEPVAERKKNTLDKIMNDFPDRRFILVGDSGEADLEVYTDVVSENPGRVLGVFIRDVTTSMKKGFFDPVQGPLTGENLAQYGLVPRKRSDGTPVRNHRHQSSNYDADLKEAITRSLADQEPAASHNRFQDGSTPSSADDEVKPTLPPRRPATNTSHSEDLIDLDFNDPDPAPHPDASVRHDSPTSFHLQPPPKPKKPRSLSSLRSASGASSPSPSEKPAPPRPRKPSTSVHMPPSDSSESKPQPETTSIPKATAEHPELPSLSPPVKPPRPETPPSQFSYRSKARTKLGSAYARLPSPSNAVFARQQQQPRQHSPHSSPRAGAFPSDHDHDHAPPPPPMPPRKPSTYTGAAGKSLSNLVSSATNAVGAPIQTTALLEQGRRPDRTALPEYQQNGGGGGAVPGYQGNPYPANKREEMWKRRWARAKVVLDEKGVMLRSWRVGGDVARDVEGLVERAIREEEKGRRLVDVGMG